jgi:HPt (histidine-containing phosphotransfer) domain-containing protein
MPDLIAGPIDWEVVERLYGGRDAEVIARLKRLGPLCARSRADLASAIARGDREVAAREAHGMKGAVRMAGATAAERAYAELEAALRSGAGVREAYERADAEFRRLEAYLDTLVG